jgi:hypothetical protein
MEQLERKNELRTLSGKETGHWWIDDAETLFATHKNTVRARYAKRTIPRLFNLKYGEQEEVIEADPE